MYQIAPQLCLYKCVLLTGWIIHSFIHWFIRSFIYSLTQSLTHWLIDWLIHSLTHYHSLSHLGPVFQCTLDRRSNWSPINFGSWSEIISITVFQSPINDWSSIKSPIKLIADYWPINEIIDDQTWLICSLLKNIASLRRSERGSSRIKMKFQS